MFPIGTASSLALGQFPEASRGTAQIGIVPALFVGANGMNCLKAARLVAEIPERFWSTARPSAVGAETLPGEAAGPRPVCSNWKKKNSLFLPLHGYVKSPPEQKRGR